MRISDWSADVCSSDLIDALRGVIDDALRRLSPKSAMAKALAYGRKRWDALTRYTGEGQAEIDNHIAQRAIRSNAIGRQNWQIGRASCRESVIQYVEISVGAGSIKTKKTPKNEH